MEDACNEDRRCFNEILPKKTCHGSVLPRLPCSKYRLIGNSKMRNKSHMNESNKRWKVPKDIVRTAAEVDYRLPGMYAKGELDLRGVKHSRLVGSNYNVNVFDKNTIYEENYQSIDKKTSSSESDGRMSTVKEKRNTKSKFDLRSRRRSYNLRNGTSFKLPSLSHEPTYSAQFQPNTSDRLSVRIGKGYHSCDVFGQRFCEQCKRALEFKTMNEAFRSSDPWPPKRKRYSRQNGLVTPQERVSKPVTITRSTRHSKPDRSGPSTSFSLPAIVIPTGSTEETMDGDDEYNSEEMKKRNRRRKTRSKLNVIGQDPLSRIEEERMLVDDPLS